ncbi:MAG: hypothetical protein NZ992_01755 [Candidatus Korarchaeum sp.]|nr:hypothetical protein [Candidatus Korarchaeum sp.]
MSDEGAPVPLIYDYLFVSRKLSSGHLVTLIVKVKNEGESEAGGLSLEAQLYPGSKVEIGGVQANPRRIGELTGVRLTESELSSSLDLPVIRSDDVSIHSFTFYTPSPVVGARISLRLGASEVDFLRVRPFSP